MEAGGRYGSQRPLSDGYEAGQSLSQSGLSAGGIDNGGPGLRRSNYFAAFVLDPEGINIEAAWRTV